MSLYESYRAAAHSLLPLRLLGLPARGIQWNGVAKLDGMMDATDDDPGRER